MYNHRGASAKKSAGSPAKTFDIARTGFYSYPPPFGPRMNTQQFHFG